MEVLNEQQRFIQCLHHASHDSFVVRFLKGKGQLSSRCLSKLESYDAAYDSYISLHGFTRYGRKAEHIRELTCIYYDLDLHRKKGNVNVVECVYNTIKILEDAIYGEETLPEPTMITRTGRGLGIFYVLKRSIACSKGRNAGQVEFWNLIYRHLGKKIKEILIPENNLLADDSEELLEFDDRILCDYSRVTRLPMTVNQATGEYCRLIFMPYYDGEPRYYSLKELSRYLFSTIYNGKRTYLKREKKKKNIVYINFSKETFLRERLHAMELLQEQRNGSCIGTRDYMCFVYYNHAVQIYGTPKAMEKLKQFNKKFCDPLPSGELRNISKGVNRNKGDSYKGHYRLTNQWIIDKCGITKEEEKKSGMKLTKRSIDRLITKETTTKKRMERNKKVISYIEEHPEKIYKDIAEYFGISLRTLKGIVKAADLHRYKKKKKSGQKDTFNGTKNRKK